MRTRKGQASLELLTGFLAWAILIAILAGALFLAGQKAAQTGGVLQNEMAMRAITNQAEQLQSAGYTVHAGIANHRTKDGLITVDYKGKEIAGKTIVGMDKPLGGGQPV